VKGVGSKGVGLRIYGVKCSVPQPLLTERGSTQSTQITPHLLDVKCALNKLESAKLTFGGVTVSEIGLALQRDKTVSMAVPQIGQNLHELDWQKLHDCF
jgi:hypothetical protein